MGLSVSRFETVGLGLRQNEVAIRDPLFWIFD
jgi:hypothetical protein